MKHAFDRRKGRQPTAVRPRARRARGKRPPEIDLKAAPLVGKDIFRFFANRPIMCERVGKPVFQLFSEGGGKP